MSRATHLCLTLLSIVGLVTGCASAPEVMTQPNVALEITKGQASAFGGLRQFCIHASDPSSSEDISWCHSRRTRSTPRRHSGMRRSRAAHFNPVQQRSICLLALSTRQRRAAFCLRPRSGTHGARDLCHGRVVEHGRRLSPAAGSRIRPGAGGGHSCPAGAMTLAELRLTPRCSGLACARR
jgi:hypothetical protein